MARPIKLPCTLLHVSTFLLTLAFLVIVSHSQSTLQARALLQFKQAITKDPLGALHSWQNVSELRMCSWFGITCSLQDGLVVSIDLPGCQLQGSITPLISSVVSLVSLDLSLNNLSGHVPSSFGMLPHLQTLKLSSNRLVGGIPVSLSNCSSLTLLDLSCNSFLDSIPAQFGALPSLRSLILSHNFLEGQLPPSLFNASALRVLDVSHNHITGLVPTSIRNLKSLLSMKLASNNFTGSIPNEIGEIMSLQGIDVSSNRLNGEVPLQLADCSFLAVVILSNNMLTGHIPSELGKLQNLRVLHIDHNLLAGSIPPSLGNCTRMEDLVLSHNLLHGVIPSTIASLPNLVISFAMSHNSLTGAIPSQIGGMFLVQQIDLAHNHLSGNVPIELGKCYALESLDLSNNQLGGLIPQSLGSLFSLTWVLNLSSNSLEGSLPGMQNLINLRSMDFSHNYLNGSIPSELLDLPSLTFFDLSFNRFIGCISPSHSSFVSKNMRPSWIEGNLDLCVPSFSGSCGCSLKGSTRPPWFIVFLLCTACLVWLGIGVELCSVRGLRGILQDLCTIFETDKYLARAEIDSELLPDSWMQCFSAEDIRNIHAAINSNTLVGRGASSCVYRVCLGSGRVLALKRYDPTAREKLIQSELLVLKNVRHRNLVCMRGFYVRGPTKGILLDYMQNGSLKQNLYDVPSSIENLDMIIQIARDVAEGLVYLHSYGSNPIIHGDLKPGNILLDEHFVAHLADFGLATYMGSEIEADFMRTRATYSVRLIGTSGYIAPEYGAFRITPAIAGDVYSYGVILLELLTRRQPADGNFPAGCYSLPEFVQSASLDGRLETVLDPGLQAQIRTTRDYDKVCLLASIGLSCARREHSKRPSMADVAASLKFHRTFRDSPP